MTQVKVQIPQLQDAGPLGLEDLFIVWQGGDTKKLQSLYLLQQMQAGLVTNTDFEQALEQYFTKDEISYVLSVKTTDDWSEGNLNLYFTESRARSAVVVDSLAGDEVSYAPSVRSVSAAISSLAGSYVRLQNAELQDGGFSLSGDGRLNSLAVTGIDSTGSVLNIGTSEADFINIGRSGATINIQGTTLWQDVTNVAVSDKLIRLNVGGSVGSAVSSGFEIEEGGDVTGYFATNDTRDGWDFKAPGSSQWTLRLSGLSANRSVTVPNASGTMMLTDAGQTISSAVWNGATIGQQYGGTGSDMTMTGGNRHFVRQGGVGAAFTTGPITSMDLPDLSDTYVRTNRTLSINGVSFDLSQNRSWTVGSVTSVAYSLGASLSSIFDLTGSPITSSGEFVLSAKNQTANQFYAAPNGANGTPTFRGIVEADLSFLPAGYMRLQTASAQSGPGFWTAGRGLIGSGSDNGTSILQVFGDSATFVSSYLKNNNISAGAFTSFQVRNGQNAGAAIGITSSARTGSFLGGIAGRTAFINTDSGIPLSIGTGDASGINISTTQNVLMGLNVDNNYRTQILGNATGGLFVKSGSDITGTVVRYEAAGSTNAHYQLTATGRHIFGNATLAGQDSIYQFNGSLSLTLNDYITYGSSGFIGNAAVLIGGGTAGLGIRHGGAIVIGNGTSAYHYLTNNYALFSTQAGPTNLSVGIPANAVLEARSTSKGFLPPRLTTSQRDQVAWAVTDEGMVIFNITIKKHQGWNGSTWNDLY